MTATPRKLADRLLEIARRVDHNIPSRHDPERFHSEKSQLVHDLRTLARSLNDP